MTSNRARQLKRERQQLERKRATREASARDTQHLQAIAAARREVQHRGRRHAIAYCMFAVAALIAVAHVFEHADTFSIISLALEDLLIGWPMAGAIALGGAIVYGT